jgi:AcrR family transcriptional regulator
MREKPFNTISVTALAGAAQLGRTTFYRNIDEIEDILRMGCDQTFDELMAYITACLKPNTIEAQATLLKPLLRYFYLHSDIIELLLMAKRIDIIQDSYRVRMQPFKAQIAARHGGSRRSMWIMVSRYVLV